MEIEHEIQRNILLKLIHNPKLTFTELLGERRDSNNFAYHLNVLKNKNLVVQEENHYLLSSEGKQLSAFIEGDTGNKAVVPTFAHGLIARNGDKLLVQRRLKEPFYGYFGFVSGKINYGFNIEECAKRDLTEETGLVAKKAKIVAINQIKTYENNELKFHHIIFLVRLDEISGDIISKTHKAENYWMELREFTKKKRLPDPWLDDVLHTDGLILLETERQMVNGEFTACKIISKRKI